MFFKKYLMMQLLRSQKPKNGCTMLLEKVAAPNLEIVTITHQPKLFVSKYNLTIVALVPKFSWMDGAPQI